MLFRSDVNNTEGQLANTFTVSVQPGLDANGNPTTIANNSISPLLINEDDDWGYVVTITGE